MEKKNTVALKAGKMRQLPLHTRNCNNPFSSVPVNPKIKKFSYLPYVFIYDLLHASSSSPKHSNHLTLSFMYPSCACKLNMCLKELNNKSCRFPSWFKYSWCWSQSRVSSSSFSVQEILEIMISQCWFSTQM